MSMILASVSQMENFIKFNDWVRAFMQTPVYKVLAYASVLSFIILGLFIWICSGTKRATGEDLYFGPWGPVMWIWTIVSVLGVIIFIILPLAIGYIADNYAAELRRMNGYW